MKTIRNLAFIFTLILTVRIAFANQTVNAPGYINPTDKKLFSKGMERKKRYESFDIEVRTPSEIVSDMVKKDDSLDLSPIDDTIDKFVKLKKSFEGLSKVKKVRKKYNIAFEKALQELELAKSEALRLHNSGKKLNDIESINSEEAQVMLSALMQGMELYEILRGEDPEMQFFQEIKNNFNFFRTISFTNERREALNLVVPDSLRLKHGLSMNRAYFSPSELNGIDLSTLDPADSGMWVNPGDISTKSTKNYSTSDPAVADLSNPDSVFFMEFDEPKTGGSNPKFDANAYVNGEKLKFKVKFITQNYQPSNEPNIVASIFQFLRSFGEAHAETVVNNLAHALGFQVMPTYSKKEIRVYLPNDKFVDTKKELDSDISNGLPIPSSSYSAELAARRYDNFLKARADIINDLTNGGATSELSSRPWDYGTAMKVDPQNVDSEGRYYFVMNNVSLEVRIENKLGFYLKQLYGRLDKREARALQMFYSFISDDDGADVNGSVLYDIDPVTDRIKLQFVPSDMGASLGFFQGKDSLWLFNPNYINVKNSVKGEKIVLTYRTRHRTPVYDQITMNDAKWFARKLGQLTAQQIEDAVASGGYHTCAIEGFTQKLVSRRDQLVWYTNLEKEMGMLSEERVKAGKVKTLAWDPKSPSKKFQFDWSANPDCEEIQKDQEGNIVTDDLGNPITVTKDFRDEKSRFIDLKNAVLNHITSIGLSAVGQQVSRIDIPVTNGFAFNNNTIQPIVKVFGWRYLVPNPAYDPLESDSKPWLIVDVARFGVGAKLVDDVAQVQSFFLSQVPQIKQQVKAIYLQEIIKIRPASEPAYNEAGLKKLIKAVANNVKRGLPLLGNKSVDQLNEEEFMIHSSYLVKGADIRSSSPALGAFGPVMRTGLEVSTVSRTLVEKLSNEESSFRVAQVGVNGWQFRLSLSAASPIFFRFPLLGVDVRNFHEKQRIYDVKSSDMINVGDSKTKSVNALQAIITRSNLGKNEDRAQGLLMQTLKRKGKESRFHLSLFGFKGAAKIRESSKSKVDNFKNGNLVDSADAKYSAIGTKKVGQIVNGLITVSDEYSARGLMVNNDTIEAGVFWDYVKWGAVKKDYEKLVKKIGPIFNGEVSPDCEVKNTLGVLKFRGVFSISTDGWHSILSKEGPVVKTISLCRNYIHNSIETLADESDRFKARMICSAPDLDLFLADAGVYSNYAKKVRVENREEYLNLVGSMRFFVNRFKETQETYKLYLTNKVKYSNRLRKDLVELLYTKEVPESVIKTLVSFTGSEDQYRLFGNLSTTHEQICLAGKDEYNADFGSYKDFGKILSGQPSLTAIDVLMNELTARNLFYDYFNDRTVSELAGQFQLKKINQN